MKKLSKTLLAVAAVSAVSAAMAASAMAADFTATYSNGTLSLSNVPDTGDSQTILVLTEDTSVTSENANDVVLQIDQKDDGTGFEVTNLDASKLVENHTYYVRIGGDGNVYDSTFTINETVEPGTTITIKIGDVNIDNTIVSGDGLILSRYLAGWETGTGNIEEEYTRADGEGTIIIGDVNFDNGVLSGDGLVLARYLAGWESNTGEIGNEYEVYSTPVNE